jgi:hypothetical protein
VCVRRQRAQRTVTDSGHVGVATTVGVPHTGSGEGNVGVLEIALDHVGLVRRTLADVGESAAGGPEESLMYQTRTHARMRESWSCVHTRTRKRVRTWSTETTISPSGLLRQSMGDFW